MTRTTRHRGLTLIEAVAAVALLAIAVPPSVAMLADAARVRAAGANAERAMWFAGAVLETVAADAASAHEDLGFDAFANTSTYLNHASTGLHARLAATTAWAASAGMSHTVTVGSLVGPSGVATGDANADVFRIVTVEVTWTGARGVRTLTLSRMVGAP